MMVRRMMLVSFAVLLGLPAMAADFRPGQVVIVQRFGKPEEVRVVRQDQYGVLVQYKDWQDGTFHEDMAVAPTAYYQPAEVRSKDDSPSAEELTPAPTDSRKPESRSADPAASSPPPASDKSGGEAEKGAEEPADSGGVEADDLPEGEYRCYTYHPKPVFVGAFTIAGASYQTRTGAAGKYRMAKGGRIEWLGTAPLGFSVGVLEETEPTPKVRMYPQPDDIGNKWKAAVCTGSAAAARPSSNGDDKAGTYAPGSLVEMTFAGYWYAATVVRCSGEKCLLDYDDPNSKDDWVETSRMRARER